jgi:type 1 glutamine amidotransferase
MRIALCILSLFTASTLAWADDPPAPAKPVHVGPNSPVPARVVTNGPDGYELAAYVDCGPSRLAASAAGSLRQLRGEPYAWKDSLPFESLGTVAFDSTDVVYAVADLKAENEYVLGFTWWDFDHQKRMQSVRFGTGQADAWTTVLPATPAESWYEDKPTWSELFLPIPESYVKAGHFEVSFHLESGPNVVVSEVWLLCKSAAQPKPTIVPKDLRRIAIITGDDYPGHLWRLTAPELATILREDPRLEVTIEDSPYMLASPLMAHYDAAIIHYMNWQPRPDPGAAVQKGLEAYVQSGKGLIFVHFACGAFQKWAGFAKIAGRIFDPKLPPHDPYGPFEVKVTDRDHPITKQMAAFKTTDELYTCLTGDTPIRVLLEATSKVDQKNHPMGFVHEVGKGHVFHSPLGHDLNALRAPGARELYRRAAAWVTGLEQQPAAGAQK